MQLQLTKKGSDEVETIDDLNSIEIFDQIHIKIVKTVAEDVDMTAEIEIADYSDVAIVDE